MEKCEMLDGKFTVIKTLKNGEYSILNLVEDQQGNQYVMKKYKPPTADIDTLQKQFNLYSSLEHQNIVQFIDVRPNGVYTHKDSTKSKCFAMILQYINGKRLQDQIEAHGKFSQKTTRAFFRQFITALSFIHSKGHAHQKIQPKNILINNNFKIKLVNFGTHIYSLAGRQGCYYAPEVKKKDHDKFKADIFSAGIILYFMCQGIPPFSKASEQTGYSKIINKQYQQFWKIRNGSSTLSQNFKNLFVKMIAQTPSERPTAKQILNDPWMKEQPSSINQIKIQFQSEKKKKEKKKGWPQKGFQSSQMNANKRGIQQLNPLQLIYQSEKSNNREIGELQVKDISDDFIISQDKTISFALLINFINNEQISVQTQAKQPQFLKCTQLDDEEDKLFAKYELNYQVLDEQFNYEVQLQIELGKTQNARLAVVITQKSGDRFYFKKIAQQIKYLFEDYLVQQ